MKYKKYKEKDIYEQKNNIFLHFLYNTILGRIVLKIMYNKNTSNIIAFFLNQKISKVIIKKYIKKHQIDLSRFEKKNYNSFNDFFTRKIKKIAKTYDDDNFIAICDSKIMVYKITKDLIITIKNTNYTLKELIKDNLSNEYNNGYCIIYRLEPKDYHHYIYNDSGETIRTKEIDGVLHTVNPVVYDKYKVFIENKREISILKTDNFDQIIQVEIGAMCVGKIKNRKISKFKRYEEKGYFEFGGSTIIQILKNNVINIDKEILENSENNIETQVEIGCIIGKKRKREN